MLEAYKVTVNKFGVFVEPCKWLDDGHFSVDLYPTKKQNKNLAKFICEKMNRAFRTGRRVQMDYAEGLDGWGRETKRLAVRRGIDIA